MCARARVCVCGGGVLLAFQRLQESIFKMAASIDSLEVRILKFWIALIFLSTADLSDR